MSYALGLLTKLKEGRSFIFISPSDLNERMVEKYKEARCEKGMGSEPFLQPDLKGARRWGFGIRWEGF